MNLDLNDFALFDEPQYQRFRKLRNIDFEGESYLMHFSVVSFACVVATVLIQNEELRKSIYETPLASITLISLTFIPFLIFTAIFQIFSLYEAIFSFFAKRRSIYREFIALEERYYPQEKLVRENIRKLIDGRKSARERIVFLASNTDAYDYAVTAQRKIGSAYPVLSSDIDEAKEIILNKIGSNYINTSNRTRANFTTRKSTSLSSSKSKETQSKQPPIQKNQSNLKTLPVAPSKPKKQNKLVYPKLTNWRQINLSRLEVGEMGEALVLQYEQNRLREIGLGYIVDQIEHSSKTIGDGLGYDIKSFNDGGEPIYIEVKTTTGGFWSNLIFTRNELTFMQQNRSDYRLYRVYHFDQRAENGELYIVPGNEMEDHFNFAPQTFVATSKTSS